MRAELFDSDNGQDNIFKDNQLLKNHVCFADIVQKAKRFELLDSLYNCKWGLGMKLSLMPVQNISVYDHSVGKQLMYMANIIIENIKVIVSDELDDKKKKNAGFENIVGIIEHSSGDPLLAKIKYNNGNERSIYDDGVMTVFFNYVYDKICEEMYKNVIRRKDKNDFYDTSVKQCEQLIEFHKDILNNYIQHYAPTILYGIKNMEFVKTIVNCVDKLFDVTMETVDDEKRNIFKDMGFEATQKRAFLLKIMLMDMLMQKTVPNYPKSKINYRYIIYRWNNINKITYVDVFIMLFGNMKRISDNDLQTFGAKMKPVYTDCCDKLSNLYSTSINEIITIEPSEIGKLTISECIDAVEKSNKSAIGLISVNKIRPIIMIYIRDTEFLNHLKDYKKDKYMQDLANIWSGINDENSDIYKIIGNPYVEKTYIVFESSGIREICMKMINNKILDNVSDKIVFISPEKHSMLFGEKELFRYADAFNIVVQAESYDSVDDDKVLIPIDFLDIIADSTYNVSWYTLGTEKQNADAPRLYFNRLAIVLEHLNDKGDKTGDYSMDRLRVIMARNLCSNIFGNNVMSTSNVALNFAKIHQYNFALVDPLPFETRHLCDSGNSIIYWTLLLTSKIIRKNDIYEDNSYIYDMSKLVKSSRDPASVYIRKRGIEEAEISDATYKYTWAVNIMSYIIKILQQHGIDVIELLPKIYWRSNKSNSPEYNFLRNIASVMTGTYVSIEETEEDFNKTMPFDDVVVALINKPDNDEKRTTVSELMFRQGFSEYRNSIIKTIQYDEDYSEISMDEDYGTSFNKNKDYRNFLNKEKVTRQTGPDEKKSNVHRMYLMHGGAENDDASELESETQTSANRGSYIRNILYLLLVVILVVAVTMVVRQNIGETDNETSSNEEKFASKHRKMLGNSMY